jgi:hypothetical protein
LFAVLGEHACLNEESARRFLRSGDLLATRYAGRRNALISSSSLAPINFISACVGGIAHCQAEIVDDWAFGVQDSADLTLRK